MHNMRQGIHPDGRPTPPDMQARKMQDGVHQSKKGTLRNEEKDVKTKFNELPANVKKAFRARQRLMLCADILDIAIVEDLPASKLMAGNLKMRTNRIRDDIDRVTKGLAGEILTGTEEGVMGSKDFAYAFYTIINILKDWPDDELFALANELKERNKNE